MNFPEPKQPQQWPSLPKPPLSILQQALSHLQNHCCNLLHHHLHQNALFNAPPFFNPNPSSLKTQLDSTLSSLRHRAQQAIEVGFSSFRSGCGSGPAWARISENSGGGGVAMSTEAIEERLTGVPVYALSNSSQEFVLISGANGKSVGLFCFKEDDAEALLEQMKSMDPVMREGSKVVAVALNKVFQLKLDGVAFRLIPEISEIENAIKSRSLILRSQGKRYRPVFFRKEDLEKSLLRASRQQKRLNPVLREGDIQVAVLEDIIQGMKDSTMATWDDVVFIPPGFDVSADPSQK
ncbi:protein TIC 22-like, chloroplastic isoform X2 [Diospyros lotus]|uniref:protein TIC 22-like, chloroplastic isoform X2 n=1 Tax=Diospyros lotus TaxID=55363 RepID=UPI002255919A|nr:protein TIC 22-like, chloroplastic isoform X2 [Diospyros lotus]